MTSGSFTRIQLLAETIAGTGSQIRSREIGYGEVISGR